MNVKENVREFVLSEERLVRLSKNGDLGAFERLILTYEKKIYNLAYRMLGNHEDAQDVTQDVFLKSYSSLKVFRGECSFSTWIYKIATNVCLDRLRKQRYAPLSLNEPVNTEDGEFNREVSSNQPGPEDIVWNRELERLVQEEISNLSADHKSIIVLRDVQGLAYEDIACILGCSLGTVKSRLNRARKALRARLASRELFSADAVKTGERRDGK